MNAFSVLKKPDPKFVEMASKVSSTQKQLEGIHALHTKALATQTAIESITFEISKSMGTYSTVETNLTREFYRVSSNISNISTAMNERVESLNIILIIRMCMNHDSI